MPSKMTRRAVLGTVIAGLAAGPFVTRALRRGGDWQREYEEKRQEYLRQISFPRVFNPTMPPGIKEEEKDLIVQVYKRFWSNFAKVRKAEFDYHSQAYDVGGVKSNGFWDMNVHVKMEYGQGFEAKGKDSTGYPVDLICTPDGCHIRSARLNGSMSSLMLSFLGALEARPDDCFAHSSIKRNVQMKPNPYIEGHGLYDVLVIRDRGRGDPKNISERHDYFSQETGMYEFRYTYFAPGVSANRGGAFGDIDTEAEVFDIRQYELVNSVYLACKADIHCPQTKYSRENRFKNYTNVELWEDA